MYLNNDALERLDMFLDKGISVKVLPYPWFRTTGPRDFSFLRTVKSTLVSQIWATELAPEYSNIRLFFIYRQCVNVSSKTSDTGPVQFFFFFGCVSLECFF